MASSPCPNKPNFRRAMISAFIASNKKKILSRLPQIDTKEELGFLVFN